MDLICSSKEENRKLDAMARKTFQMRQPSVHQCTMLFVLNLAEPQWVTVPCNEPLLYTVICSKRKTGIFKSVTEVNSPFCLKIFIRIKGTCYMFLRFYRSLNGSIDVRNILASECKMYGMKVNSLKDYSNFQAMFTATKLSILSFMLIHPSDKYMVNLVTYERLWMKIMIKKRQTRINALRKEEIHHVCEGMPNAVYNITHYGNILPCNNGRLTSSLNICNMENECNVIGSKPYSHCSKMPVFKQRCSSLLFYRFYKGTCLTFSNVNNILTKRKIALTSRFIQNKDISNSMAINNKSKCNQQDQLPCEFGKFTWFRFSSICVYRLDKIGQLFPCVNGSHLQECGNYECNQHFKCPGYYCIPWGYICDGKWDCPFGSDEHGCSVRHCYGLFKCMQSCICLHIGDICDGYKDCPTGDDEFLCALVGFNCPENCKCLNLGIICLNTLIDVNIFYSLPHISVQLSKCNLQSVPYWNQEHSLIVLNVSMNSITSICGRNVFAHGLSIIDLSNNEIMMIRKHCFLSLNNLTVLQLQNNKIEVIQGRSFLNLRRLHIINLSNNKLSILSKNLFENVTELKLLILFNNSKFELSTRSGMLFLGLKTKFIITDHKKICCLSIDVTEECLPKNNLHTCKLTILDTAIIPVLVVTCLMVFINIASIILHSKQRHGPINVIVNAQSMINMTYALYLLLLLFVEKYHRGNMPFKEVDWRSSFLCTLALTSVIAFNFISIFVTAFLSFARLMIVIHPLKSAFRHKQFVFQKLLIGIIFISLLSVTFSLAFKWTNWTIPSMLCHPFIDQFGYGVGVKEITLFQLSTHSLAVVFIKITYGCMLQSLTAENTNISFSMKRKTFTIIAQVFSLTMGSLISWMVTSTIYLVCLFINIDAPLKVIVLEWTTVVVVPIKSIVDPAVFIIAAIRKDSHKHLTKCKTIDVMDLKKDTDQTLNFHRRMSMK